MNEPSNQNKNPTVIVRVLWVAMFFSGFVIAMVMPPILLEPQIQNILYGFAGIFVLLSFTLPQAVVQLTRMKAKPGQPQIPPVVLTSILQLVLLESALLMTLIASGSVLEVARVYIIVGYGVLLASQFPSSPTPSSPPQT